ncbi:MAG: class I SAM-dependent methyltransferase [Anaerolineales bacterium]
MSNIIQKLMKPKKQTQEDLGLELRPGAAHYRAYVGPPKDYDLVAAMSFNLLTTLGLRQGQTVLDIGCGSLRIGRLLIPYLNVGNYTGIEPNEWLVKDGIEREVGQDQIRIKKPNFYYSDSAEKLPPDAKYDFAIAQSIFSHCGADVIKRWLGGISPHMSNTGAFVATFLIADQDYGGSGWVYPECVNYKVETMKSFADQYGFVFQLLDWKHPRQTWALFSKPGFDTRWFSANPLTWNTMLGFVLKK